MMSFICNKNWPGGFCYVPFFFLFGGGRWDFFLRFHIIHHHCFFLGEGLEIMFIF